MASPLRHSVYSYRFAVMAVEGFLDKYSRVALFIAKKLGMDGKDFKMKLIYMFMRRNARWQVMREVLKKVHNYEMYATIAPMSRAETVKYLTAVSTLIEDDILDGTIRLKKS